MTGPKIGGWSDCVGERSISRFVKTISVGPGLEFLKTSPNNKLSGLLVQRIGGDLRESRIGWRLVLMMVPVAFLTYLFHEFGHWSVGEMLGNDMVLGLNLSNARSGTYIGRTDALYVSLGGPLFTLLQAVIGLILVEKTKSIYAYSFLYFAAFCRFFSILLGGYYLQDEARISALLHVNRFAATIVVLTALFVLVWRGSRTLKLSAKAVGYFAVLSTLAILLVIAVDRLTV